MTVRSARSVRQAAALGAVLVLAWAACAWILVGRSYDARVDALVAAQEELVEVRARDLAGSIQRNLQVTRGIPDLLAQSREVIDALRRPSGEAVPRDESPEFQAARWKADPQLRHLDRFLATAQASLAIDVLYVADFSGRVVAASDFERAGPGVGTSLLERDYFLAARGGRHGLQYAIGKSTGIPGLYFSSPVVDNGGVIGVVVAKVHMPNLSFLLDQSNAFLTDANGVVIMAHDRALEMTVLSSAPLGALSESDRLARYRRTTFPVLPISPSDQGGRRPLLQLSGAAAPGVLAVSALPEYGIDAHVYAEIAAIPELRAGRFWFALLLALAGGLVILMLEAAVLYLRSVVRAKARLWEKAHFDGLTGLANRELFRRRLAQAADTVRDDGRSMALLVGDLDGFKKINDTLGHGAGDQVLQDAARRIAGCVRATDTVARLGGDEFAIVLGGIGSARRASDVAMQIVTRMATPFPVRDDLSATLTVSLGIALLPDDARDVDALFALADEAMYAAKRQGGNRYAHASAGESASAAPAAGTASESAG